jgi:hypothetical protein
LTTLRAISQGKALGSNGTTALLVAESESADSSNKLGQALRSQALKRLAGLASNGAIIYGPSASTLACSALGSKRAKMVSDTNEESVDVALLAFDADESSGIVYTLVDVPKEGAIYATTALPSAIYPQVLRLIITVLRLLLVLSLGRISLCL